MSFYQVDESSVYEELKDSIKKSFSYWKCSHKEAFKSTLGSIRTISKKLTSSQNDASQGYFRNRFSDVVTEIAKDIADQTSSILVEESLDSPRHSLELKRLTLLKFISFLEETQFFSYLNRTHRLYYCSLLERIAGLQSLRQFQILNSGLFHMFIKSIVQNNKNCAYPSPDVDSDHAENSSEYDKIFYSYVTVSPILITEIIQHISTEITSHLKDGPYFDPKITYILQTSKGLLSYITSVLNASDMHSEHLKISENKFKEDYCTFNYTPIHSPPKNSALDWLSTLEFSGKPILASFQILAKDLCSLLTSVVNNFTQHANDYKSGDLQTKEKMHQTLLIGIETNYSLCIHILETAFRIFCLASPINSQFVEIRDGIFPLCLRLERAASQLYSDVPACGFDHTAEFAQKYCSVSTLIFIAFHNEVLCNSGQYQLTHLYDNMKNYPDFRTLAFQYFVDGEVHRHLLYCLPYEISNEAFKFLENNPRLQWPILIVLTQQKASFINEENIDWITIMSDSKIDNENSEVLQEGDEQSPEIPSAFMKAFLAIYAVVLGSDSTSERLFFLGMAKTIAKAGTLNLPNTALDSMNFSYSNINIPSELVKDDLHFEMTMAYLQNKYLMKDDKIMVPSNIILEVLKKYYENPPKTYKERSKLRRILRDIALILPRFLLTNPRASVLKLFWKLVLIVDDPLWKKLYLLGPDLLDLRQLNIVEDLIPLDISCSQNYIIINLCQHSLLYELLVKFSSQILIGSSQLDIRDIADEIDPKLSLLVQNCLILYEKSTEN